MNKITDDLGLLFLFSSLFYRIFANKYDLGVKKRNKYYFRTINKGYIRCSPHTTSVGRENPETC